MPLANFPVKPRTPSRATEFKLPPKQAKREHRGARVYELKSPIPKPESAVLYDRPRPILTLPGLPSSPVTLDLPKDDSSGFASKVLKTSKQYVVTLTFFINCWCKNVTYFNIRWFGQIKVPFVRDPLTPKIPPTPKTADWYNENWANETPYSASKSKVGSLQKKNAIRHKRKPEGFEESNKDPPPLYSKHPEEGSRKAWMSVAGAYVLHQSFRNMN